MPQQTASPADRVRATRFSKRLFVASKTIGTEVTFNLSTQNVSRSGLKLGWEQMRPIPFIENTIIEMTIDPMREFLKEPLQCLGKVVRREGVQSKQSGSNLSFGISIIQIDATDLDLWESCLAAIAALPAADSDDAPILSKAG